MGVSILLAKEKKEKLVYDFRCGSFGHDTPGWGSPQPAQLHLCDSGGQPAVQLPV